MDRTHAKYGEMEEFYGTEMRKVTRRLEDLQRDYERVEFENHRLQRAAEEQRSGAAGAKSERDLAE